MAFLAASMNGRVEILSKFNGRVEILSKCVMLCLVVTAFSGASPWLTWASVKFWAIFSINLLQM